jgi:hypothetical protein
MTQVQRFLAFLVAVFAVAVLLGLLGSKLLSAGGPAGEIITELKTLERRGLSKALQGGRLHSSDLQYDRISVVVDQAGERAMVTATLDFTGNLERDGGQPRTRISSLGLEKMTWTEHRGAWTADQGELPRLASIVEALERRRLALQQGDGGSFNREYRAEAWFIRSERAQVLVSEDWRLLDERPDRAMVRSGTTRIDLLEVDAGFALLP